MSNNSSAQKYNGKAIASRRLNKNVVFFIIFLLVFLTILSPKILSETAYCLLAVFGFFCFLRNPKEKYRFLCFFSFIYFFLISILSYKNKENIFLYLVEAKILLYPFVALFFKKSVSLYKVAKADKKLNLLIWFILIINAVYFLLSGFSLRYMDAVDFGSSLSIYMGVTTASAFIVSNNSTQKALLIFFTLMSGSGTALLVLIVSYLAKNINYFVSKFTIKSIVLSFTLVFLFLFFMYYNLEFRERNILDLTSIDRYQLTSAGVAFIYHEFNFLQFLFGYGIGRDIENIYKYFMDSATVVPWLINSRAHDGFTGLVFHSEYLRMMFNFGLVGLVLISLVTFYFFKNNIPVLFILLVCSFVSTILYVSSVMAIVFLLSRLFELKQR